MADDRNMNAGNQAKQGRENKEGGRGADLNRDSGREAGRQEGGRDASRGESGRTAGTTGGAGDISDENQ